MHMERRRRLGDLLARPAGELLAHGLDHLPLARHHLQRLGDVLAELGEPAAAARAGGRAGNHDALARQMRREGRATGFLRVNGRQPSCPRPAAALGRDLVLRRRRFQLLELQLQLVEQLAAALARMAVLLAPQLGDQQLADGRPAPRRWRRAPRPAAAPARSAASARSAARSLQADASAPSMSSAGRDRRCHGRSSTIRAIRGRAFVEPQAQPAASGRQVRCGFRQSIPSSI